MARIQVDVITNEVDNAKWGTFEVHIIGGLDEDAEKILMEALERVKTSLAALPEEKRYPRHFKTPEEL